MVALRRDDEQASAHARRSGGARPAAPRALHVVLPLSTPMERGRRTVAEGDEGQVAAARPPLHVVRPADHAPLPRVRSDALPEHTDYRDTGCDVSESCLGCPLARCKYDEPVGGRSLSATARNREIVLLRERYRAPINLLASTYGVTRRTVFRALREARLKTQRKRQAC